MGSYQFPALSIHTEGESPLQQYGQALQIKGEMQSQEMGQIQLQNARMQQQSNQAIMTAIANHQGDLDAALAEARQGGKALPADLINLQEKSVALQTAMYKKTDAQLAALEKQNGLITNAIDSVKPLPFEQRGQAILNAVGDLGRQNVDVSQGIETIRQLVANPTDEAIHQFDVLHMGVVWAQNKAKAENEYVPSQQENKAAYQANVDKTIADTNQAAAKASLDLKQAAQLGQVTPKDQYERQTQLLKSVYDRQTAFSNTLYQSGLKQLDSMFTDPQHGYTQFLAQAQNTKNTISAAKNGNEVAASLEPLMTALGVTSFAGVHRINQNEVNAAGPAVGSLYRQLNSTLSKLGSGSVPQDTLKEVDALVDGMIDAKHASLVNGANMVAANNGMTPSKVMVMGRDGTLTTLDKAGQNNPRVGGGVSVAPPGATHIVPGKDGKNHYTNAAGTVDLGIAP